MNYPLQLSFKVMAISPQVSVTDSLGRMLFYVKQKAFKLKESVTVFADQEQTRPVAKINADRVIDLSATYHFEGPDGQGFGAVRRRGMSSLWKAHYEIIRKDQPFMSIREDNGWIKFLDGIVTQIPVLSLFAGYVFHPSYTVARADGTPALRLKKRPAFLEGKFSIEKLSPLDTEEEALALTSLIMMVLLERRRG